MPLSNPGGSDPLALVHSVSVGAAPAQSGAMRLEIGDAGIRIRAFAGDRDLRALYADTSDAVYLGDEDVAASARLSLDQLPVVLSAPGGGAYLSSGRGGDASALVSAGDGGSLRLLSGDGGAGGALAAGAAGDITFQGGAGGASSAADGGRGGRIYFNAGTKGTGTPNGTDGFIEFAGELLIDNGIQCFGLPTSDPHNAGVLWSNAGVVMQSAG